MVPGEIPGLAGFGDMKQSRPHLGRNAVAHGARGDPVDEERAFDLHETKPLRSPARASWGIVVKGAWEWLWAVLYLRRVELVACTIELMGLGLGVSTDLSVFALCYAVTGLMVSETLGTGGYIRRLVDS